MKGSSSVSVSAVDGGDSLVSSASKVDSGRSHKEAERRRRQRINAHLSTLRSLLPNTTKTDKASLLAEVVEHVRELRRKVADMARRQWSESDAWQFPGESDEASLSFCGSVNGSETGLVKAMVCCEERVGLSGELARAVGSARGRAVRAEMSTVGGRTRHAMVVELGGGEERLRSLARALNAVVDNRVGSDSSGSGACKRARVHGSGDGGDCDELLH